jgi:hypothetical protein
MFIPDPDFLSIPDLGATKEEREKTIHKIENYVIFLSGREKNVLFIQKIVTKVSKIWIRDPGSEIINHNVYI